MLFCSIAILTALSAHAGDRQGKIQPWVLSHTEGGQKAEFFVIMKERADLSPAEQLARKVDKGRYVYATLFNTAKRSQVAIQAWLKRNQVSFQSFYVINGLLVKGDRKLVDKLAGRADVERIEGNPRIDNKLPKPNFAGVSQPDAVAAVEPNITKTRAPDVWTLGFTGLGIVVGDADTGMRWTHNALKNHYRGWDGTTADHNYNWHDSIHNSSGNPCGNNSAVPCDDHGHGTHTIGTVIGDDGGANQIGMAPGAKWIGCRNMDQGFGSPATYLECFEFWLAPYPIGGTPSDGDPTQAPDVTSNSWGCVPAEGCSDLTLQAAVDAQKAAGIITVVAVGNSGPGCNSVDDPPSLYDSAYVVGATTNGDLMASFSSRGPADTTNLMKPDIVAPGVNVRSSLFGGDSFYGLSSGTSMAAPHVAGAVALLWSAIPSLQNQQDQTECILNGGALRLPSIVEACGGDYVNGPNNSWGSGRVDVFQAVTGSPSTNLTSSIPGGGQTQVDLNWDAVPGAVEYEIYRTTGTCPGSGFTFLNTTVNTSYSDSAICPGATYSYLVKAVDSNNCPLAFSNCVDETLAASCLLCDCFDDGVLDPNWTYMKPNWSEASGNLIGTPSGKKSVAVATPIFAGCSVCTVQAQMETAGGLGNKVWLLAWYLDDNNKIELLMKEEKDVWILKQWMNGSIVAKTKTSRTIDPAVAYQVVLSFDGTAFHVSVDGTNLINQNAVGMPTGTVGFKAKATTGRFNQIQVN